VKGRECARAEKQAVEDQTGDGCEGGKGSSIVENGGTQDDPPDEEGERVDLWEKGFGIENRSVGVKGKEVAITLKGVEYDWQK
jgi:hypothetical protein